MKRLTKETILRCLVIAGFFVIVNLINSRTSLGITKPYEKQKTDSEQSYPQDVPHKLSAVYPNVQARVHRMCPLFVQQIEDSARLGSLDSIHGDRSRTIKLKDPKMAILCAIIPGIMVHGSGHFYGGKRKTGFLLLGAEAAGGFLIYASVLFTLAGATYETGTGLMALTGAVLFVGSWVYDVIVSPLAVIKQNQELLRGRGSGLRLQIKDESLRLAVTWGF